MEETGRLSREREPDECWLSFDFAGLPFCSPAAHINEEGGKSFLLPFRLISFCLPFLPLFLFKKTSKITLATYFISYWFKSICCSCGGGICLYSTSELPVFRVINIPMCRRFTQNGADAGRTKSRVLVKSDWRIPWGILRLPHAPAHSTHVTGP